MLSRRRVRRVLNETSENSTCSKPCMKSVSPYHLDLPDRVAALDLKRWRHKVAYRVRKRTRSFHVKLSYEHECTILEACAADVKWHILKRVENRNSRWTRMNKDTIVREMTKWHLNRSLYKPGFAPAKDSSLVHDFRDEGKAYVSKSVPHLDSNYLPK